ncbi:MAG: serine/threonine-protein kinase [Myxococcales bacterium]
MSVCPTCSARYADDLSTCPVDGAVLGPDDAELYTGSMVGEYRVERKLGEGGFGTVYRVVHPVIGKTAALKVLSTEFSSSPEMVQRFVSEGRSVNQIRHKGIVDIFAFGVLPSGRQYFVMELLEGMPLDRYLEEHGALAPSAGIPMLRSISRALDAAHAAGIVHRDLKPENVFLVFDDEGVAHTKLLDFGIAKYVGETPDDARITRTGTPLGSPRYMAPEQCRALPVDHRADIYALGVMSFQVLTGRLPFEAPAAVELMYQHLNATPPIPSKVLPSLGKIFDQPILHMLEKDLDARPPSAGKAIEALVQAAEKAGHTIITGTDLTLPRGAKVPQIATTPAPAELADTSPSLHSKQPLQGLRAAPSLSPSTRLPEVTQRDRPKNLAGTDSSDQLETQKTAPGLGRRGLLAAVLAAAVLGAGTGFLWLRGKTADPVPPPPPPAIAKPDPVPVPPPPPPVAVPPEPDKPVLPEKARRVAVTVRSAVKATVMLGTEKLGQTGEMLSVPWGTQPVTLAVKASGYQPASVEVVPDEDRSVEAALKPVPKKLNKDLENPFER